MPFLDDFARDLRFAFRQLAQNRLFALVIILSLGVAIGANTAIFTLLDAIALRQLAVPQASRLVEVNESTSQNNPRAFTYAQLNELRARQSVFSSISGWLLPMENIEVKGTPSLRAVQYVTGDFYSTFPVRALLGRTLLPSDSHPSSGGPSAVAVISFECWKDRFGGDPNVIGQIIRVEGRPFSVIGVTSSAFSTPQFDVSADATIPVESAPFQLFNSDLESMSLLVSARLLDGISLQQADAQLQVLWPAILRDSEPAGVSSKDLAEDLSRRVRLVDGSRGRSFLRSRFTEPIRILMAGVASLLVLACFNVASLLLARSSVRSGEIAVRLAVGASPSRIMRQLLTESFLLAAASAAVGLALAQWSGPALLSLMWFSPVKLTISLRPDAHMLAFMIAVAFLATMLFGIAPGWTTIRESASLQAGSRTIVGFRGGWLRRGLVAAQVSVAVVLLAGAGLLIRTAHTLATARLGFEPQHVASLRAHSKRRRLRRREHACLPPRPAHARFLNSGCSVRISFGFFARPNQWLGRASLRGVGPAVGDLRAESESLFRFGWLFQDAWLSDSSRSRLLALRRPKFPARRRHQSVSRRSGFSRGRCSRPCHLHR